MWELFFIVGGDSFLVRGRIGWLGEILRIFGSEEQRKRRKSNCNQGYLGKLFRYSWNFYPCSIFQRVCFWIFIVLLILCGRKGPQIVLLILVVYLFLSLICLWSSPLAWAHWKIMRCGFILFWSRVFVPPCFSLFSTILVFVFLPTRPMSINSSYGGDSKAWACNHEIQQRDQPLQNSG